MKITRLLVLVWILLLTPALTGLAAPVTSAFTYQGRLTDAGSPAAGNYDFQFTLYNAATGGSPVGTVVTNEDLAVSSGLFTAELDFGAGAFAGESRWLEISVRPGSSAGAFTALTPRQPVTATPYALFALSSSNAVTAASATSIPWTGVTGIPAAFSDGIDNDTTYTAGPGLNLAGSALSLDSAFTDALYWKLGGNAGTTAGTHYLGTADNQPLEIKVNNERVFRFEPSILSPNLIGGSVSNSVGPGVDGATIAGGGLTNYPNVISADYATIGGGTFHTVAGPWATVAGGRDNWIFSESSAIAGGHANQIGTNSGWSFIGGGYLNVIRPGSFTGVIGGGNQNTIHSNSHNAIIGGGYFNVIQTNSGVGVIGGGNQNTIHSNSPNATIGGGKFNHAGGDESTIAGGAFNHALAFSATIGGGGGHRIESVWSVIAGGRDNIIASNSGYNTIGGGLQNNIARSEAATISGGAFNRIFSNAPNSIIGGGIGNQIYSDAHHSSILGGVQNQIFTNSSYSVINGGFLNVVSNGSTTGGAPAVGTIGGGFQNRVSGWAATIAGGWQNVATETSDFIGGGSNNTVSNIYSSVVGGFRNNVTGMYSIVGGGYSNLVTGIYSAIPGGNLNQAANFSFAAGSQAKAIHSGAFVWADNSSADFQSTANNQFSVRASGGVRLVTSGAGATLDGQPLLAGTVGSSALSGTYANPLTLNNAGNIFSGTFSGTGSGLSGVNATTLDGLDSENFWKTSGNNVGAGQFIGSTNQEPLELRVNNQRVLRLESFPGISTVSNLVNVLAGSAQNYIAPGVVGATIGGGGGYYFGPGSNLVTASFGTIGGGHRNTVSNQYGFIGGGYNNVIFGSRGVVAGGQQNMAGEEGFVGGGFRNVASNFYSTASGGALNIASGYASTIPGGTDNHASGSYSLAAGLGALATNNGAFVWADAQFFNFTSTKDNEFNVRAGGGVRIHSDIGIHLNAADRPMLVRDWDVFATNAPTYKAGIGRWGMFMEPLRLTMGIPADDIPGRLFQVAKYSTNGTYTTLMQVAQSGVVTALSFTPTSDRNAKENFTSVSSREILDKVASLPISRWSFKEERGVEHIGPMAQDFKKFFAVGENDRTIATVDADGVALAAIQGLNQKLEQELKQKNQQLESLQQRVERLEKTLTRLAAVSEAP